MLLDSTGAPIHGLEPLYTPLVVDLEATTGQPSHDARMVQGAQKAAKDAAEAREQARTAAEIARDARKAGKPELTEQNIVPYIDWVAVQLVGDAISTAEANTLLRCAELAISLKHAQAQGTPTTERPDTQN